MTSRQCKRDAISARGRDLLQSSKEIEKRRRIACGPMAAGRYGAGTATSQVQAAREALAQTP
jgi:hypothetical protein